MSTSPRPQKRTASTCVTCRARKVRCDGRRGICTNCDRLGFTCSYDENVGVESMQADGHSHGAIAVPRRRVRQACLNCHSKKARCSGSVPQCDRCRLQGLECVYRPGKRSMPLPSSASATSDSMMRDESDPGAGYDHGTFAHGSASPSAAGFDPPEPDEALAMKAFDGYFKNVHHIPMFSFLHRASLMERYHAGTLDRSLLLAIIGITSLLSEMGPGMDEYGERCIDDAASLCLAELEKPSILRLQALVLVVKHRILSKRFSSAFMLHAIASRFATALRLNHENPSLCFLARESRRRLMWSIYMIDSALAGGQADFALWPDAEHQIHIQLPCNERHFEFDLPETTEPLQPPPLDPQGMVPSLPDVVGFMALHVRIHWIRTRILQCTLKAAAMPTAEELAALPSRCAGLAAELEAFEARMPLSFRWSDGNLRLRAYSPRLGIFVMTHVWWRQCHLDLYRMFLPGLKEALPHSALAQLDPHMVAQYRRNCYEHAKAMADMFAQLVIPGNGAPVTSTPITDIDLPGCAFQCVRVLYHGLQTAADEMGFTRDRVQGLAAECLRASRQSTAGPACASIQSDIEKLIAEGLQLLPASYVPEMITAAMDDAGMHAPQRPHASCSHAATSGVDSLAMTMSMVSSASMLAMAPVAASSVSGGTGGSNAFEESLDAFNFGGPELTGPESWTTFSLSNDWLDMGQLGDGGG
ncbi:hypothetical protein OQA88_5614 [Cercophora sp. LCS_1]